MNPEIIQKIYQCMANNSTVIIDTLDDNCSIGQIEDFDGQSICIKNTDKTEIRVDQIKNIEESSMLQGKRVCIETRIELGVIDGVVMTCSNDAISVISINGLIEINQSDIISIKKYVNKASGEELPEKPVENIQIEFSDESDFAEFYKNWVESNKTDVDCITNILSYKKKISKIDASPLVMLISDVIYNGTDLLSDSQRTTLLKKICSILRQDKVEHEALLALRSIVDLYDGFEKDILMLVLDNNGVVTDKQTSFTHCMYSILSSDFVDLEVLSGWNSYFVLTDDEKDVVADLYDEKESFNEWSEFQADKLAKAIILDYKSLELWRMFGNWIKSNKPCPEVVICNIMRLQAEDRGNIKKYEPALKFAIRNDFRKTAIYLLKILMRSSTISWNVVAQKNLKRVLRLEWGDGKELRSQANELFSLLKKSLQLKSRDISYRWNCLCVAFDLAVNVGKQDIFLDLFINRTENEEGKLCSALLADCLIRQDNTLIQRLIDELGKNSSDIPFKRLVIDFADISKKRQLETLEIEVLKTVLVDYGNRLSLSNLIDIYSNYTLEGKWKIGIQIVKTLRQYFTDDPVLYEAETWFLRTHSTSNAGLKSLYQAQLMYCRAQKEKSIYYHSIPQMSCGRALLMELQMEVEAFDEHAIKCEKSLKKDINDWKLFCDEAKAHLSGISSELLTVFYSSIYTGNWIPFIEHASFNNIDSQAIEREITNLKNLAGVAWDLSRTVIRSVALFYLTHSKANCQKATPIMELLWKLVKPSFGSLCFQNIITSMDPECKKELCELWKLDLSEPTILRQGLGLAIVKSEFCEEISPWFLIFIKSNFDIFSNSRVSDYLEDMPKEKALSIAKTFEALYVSNSSMDRKGTLHNANLESNVFSDYLKDNDDSYYTEETAFNRYESKYKVLCRYHNTGRSQETHTLFPMEKTQYETINGLYYFYECVRSDEKVKNTDKFLLINAITLSLGDNAYERKYPAFVNNLTEEDKEISLIVLLIEQGLYVKAYERIQSISDRATKLLLLVKLNGILRASEDKSVVDLSKKCWFEIKKNDIVNNLPIMIKLVTHCDFKRISLYDIYGIHSSEFGALDRESTAASDNNRAIRVVGNGKKAVFSAGIRGLIQELMEGSSSYSWALTLQDDIMDVKAKCDEKGNLSLDDYASLVSIASMWIKYEKNISSFELFQYLCAGLEPMFLDDNEEVINLINSFIQYVQFYDDIETLIRDYGGRKDSFAHLAYKQGFSDNEIDTLSEIIRLLDNTFEAVDKETEDLCGWLKKERNLLSKIKMNGSVRFRSVVTHLDDLFMGRINELSMKVEFSVNVEGITPRKDDMVETTEIWGKDTNNSSIRGYIENVGSMDAKNAKLQIELNNFLYSSLQIDEIYHGERIPFKISFPKKLLVNNAVQWRVKAWADGLDAVIVSGVIHVEETKDSWKYVSSLDPWLNPDNSVEGTSFKGRKDEIKFLQSLYNKELGANTYPPLLVMGLKRNGKSSLIRKFLAILGEYNNLKPLMIDGQECLNSPKVAFVNKVIQSVNEDDDIDDDVKSDFVHEWYSKMGTDDWMTLLPDFYKALSSLYDKKIIIFLDEMETVFFENDLADKLQKNAFMGIIRAIVQNYRDRVSFVFCGSNMLMTNYYDRSIETQLFQNLQRINVGRMSLNDIKSIFVDYNRASDIKFSDSAIKEIYKYTGGQIWYSKIIAYHVLLDVLDQEKVYKKEILPADVMGIVEKLVLGELGVDQVNKLDADFGAVRQSALRMLAACMSNKNESVERSVLQKQMLKSELGEIKDDELIKVLNTLKEMDLVENDTLRDDSYAFTTELNRIICSGKPRIHKFVVA